MTLEKPSYAEMASVSKTVDVQMLHEAMATLRKEWEDKSEAQGKEISELKQKLEKVGQELQESRQENARLQEKCKDLGGTIEQFGKIVQAKAFPAASDPSNAEVNAHLRKVVNEAVQKEVVSQVVQKEVWETVERKSRAKSLRITGLEESPDESPTETKEKVVQLLKSKMQISNPELHIESAVRVGRLANKDASQNRVILARCVTAQSRGHVLAAKPRLKGSNVGVDEDRTPAQQAAHYRLVQLMREARQQKKHARIVGGRLFVNGALVGAGSTVVSGGAASVAAVSSN